MPSSPSNPSEPQKPDVKPSEDGLPTGGQGEASEKDTTGKASGVEGLLWGALKALAWIVGGLVVLVGLVLILLQFNWGAKKVGDAIIGLANPFDEATITVDDIDGNWLSRLELHGVTLTRDDTVRMAQIDTLNVRYRLLDLLRGRIHIREAYVANPIVRMTQRADSTWDLLAALGQDTTTAADTTSRGFIFLVDQIRLRNGDFTARFYPPEQDSTLQIRNLTTQLDSLVIGDGIDLDLDQLRAEVKPPGQDDFVDLAARGRLRDSRLALDSLRLSSPTTNLFADGTLLLPDANRDAVESIDFRLRADPLAFEDLAPFIPALPQTGTANLDVALSGTSDLLEADIDGTFSDGSSVHLEGTLSPFTDGPVTYQLTGEVRELNPAFFLGGEDATAGRINADLTADLQGTSLDQLEGTARALVFDTRYGEYAVNRGVIEAQFNDGQAEVDLETNLRGTGIDLVGTIRPFDETPTYDLSGQISNFDLGQFTEGGTQSSDISGSFRLQGEGFDPQQADTRATIDLAPSRINRYQINDGQLTARLNGGTLDLDTELSLPEGRVAAEGDMQFGEELTYRIRNGSFQNLDVAALVGDTTRSSLTGTFSLRGQGTDPAANLRLDDLRVTLDDSYYSTYDIDNAVLTGRLRGGRLDFQADADLRGGAFDVAGSMRPFDDVISYTLTSGTFQNVNVAELTGNPNQQSDLSGEIVELSGRGFDPQTMRLDGRVNLAESRYNRQAIQAASLTLNLEDGVLAFETRLETLEGISNLAGTFDFSGEAPSLLLREGRLTSFNLGALLGIDGLDTALNGSITELDMRGTDPQTMMLRATIDFEPSRINDASIVDGEAQVTLEDGFARVGADLQLEQGAVVLNASGRFFDERPTYEAVGSMQNIDIGALAGVDTMQAGFSADFGIQGEGFDPETMRLQARIDGRQAYYDSVRVGTLTGRFQLANGVLQVDTLTARSNVANLEAGGQVALFDSLGTHYSDFTLDAEVIDPAPLRSFVQADVFSLGEGTLHAEVRGAADSLRFSANAAFASLAYNDIRIADLNAETSGRLSQPLAVETGEIHLNAAFFSIPALTLQQTSFDATYLGEEITFSADVTVDQRRDARLGGRVDLRPESQRVLVEDLDLRFDNDRWELLQPATISYGDEYRVSNFLLYTEDQQIALDGVIDLDGEQSLVLTIEQLRIGAVADLLEYDGLDGTLNGSLVLTGPAAAPNLEGTLNFDVISFEQAVGDLSLTVNYDDLRLNLDGELTHEDGSTLTVAGYVPIDLRLTEGTGITEAGAGVQVQSQQANLASDVSLQIVADRFNVGWIEPFLNDEMVDEVEGTLTGEVDVTGTLGNPQLQGQALFSNGRLRLPEFGVTYTDIRADAELTGNQIVLNHAELRTGEGSLIADGTINLAELTLGEFNITASAEDFRAIDTNEYRILASADLELSGTTRAPVVQGDVDLISGDIYLTDETSADEFGPVVLTEADLRMLERTFGLRVTEADTTTFSFYEALRIDLDVEMERDVWLRSRKNPDMNIQFTGELDLQKEPYSEEQMFGTIEVIPERSYIDQFGRRFSIQNGTLTFNGPATDPYLDIEAVYDVRARASRNSEIQITLSVDGRLDNLDLDLSSNPPTDMANIVSYIATGQPADKAFQLGGVNSGAIGVGTDLALNQLANIVEGAAGEELGLDVIEIRQEGLRGTTITAGKYLSTNLYASVSWPITFNSTVQDNTATSTDLREFTIEYELFNWLLLRVSSSGSLPRVNLLYEFSY